ncbi:hypothetical protein EXIGLDRAFT_753993 [Exidia glandulosa HHB12029]|uniref:Uncharacterized protein n=1 Tax=Exidia glandulosa HHB12029 TaxID=1314781 RepID=A0A165DC44_EXIGL|nr:hypothetical protein EXIGLDRAFT_753993 [Exidia glandulosa HHB12029]
MAQFTDFDAYREGYFADPTANGPTAHPPGSAQRLAIDGQPSPQDAGRFDVFSFNQSALGNGAFDGLISNSAGVSATGYIPGAEDMQNLAQLGFGSDLPSQRRPTHDPNVSQYAHMQTNMQTGRDRSWSASSRVSMASAAGDQRTTLFPEVPPGMYPSTFPNVSTAMEETAKRSQYGSTNAFMPPQREPSHFQNPNATHVYLAQPPRSTRSFSIPAMQRQTLSPQVAARGPEGSTPHGQFAVEPSSSYTRPKKRHVEEESNGPEHGVSGRHERGSVEASTKRQRRGSTRRIDGLQATEQKTKNPFAMNPFAQGHQHGAATALDQYLSTRILLAPLPELDAWGGGPEQQQFAQQPTAHSLPASKKGSRRNLTAKMRQDLARMKAARNTRLEARAPAAYDEHGPIDTSTASSDTGYAAGQANELVARASSELANPASTYPAQAAPGDWGERAMNEAYGLVSAPGPYLQDSAPANELLATPSFEQASRREYDAAIFPDLPMGLAPVNAIQGQNPSTRNGDWEAWHHHSGDPSSVDAFVNHPTGGGHATSDWLAFSNALAADSSASIRASAPGPEEFFGRVELVPPPTGALPSSSYGTGGSTGQYDGILHERPGAFAAPSPLNGAEHARQGTGCPSRCQSCHGAPSAGHSHAFLDDHSSPDEDVSPVAETSKAGAKRASTSRPSARGNNKTGTAKRGRQADTAAGPSASKSSGSRVQQDNKFTPTNPPRPLEHLPEIVLGETPCPFCVDYMIRTKHKNSPLPSMCQARDHFFGHNNNAPCPAFVFWCVSWPIDGDPVGIPIIGEIIVTHWPDEVAGTKEKDWFTYRMWGARTLLRPELIKWWKGLSDEEKDEILGKGKGE